MKRGRPRCVCPTAQVTILSLFFLFYLALVAVYLSLYASPPPSPSRRVVPRPGTRLCHTLLVGVSPHPPNSSLGLLQRDQQRKRPHLPFLAVGVSAQSSGAYASRLPNAFVVRNPGSEERGRCIISHSHTIKGNTHLSPPSPFSHRKRLLMRQP